MAADVSPREIARTGVLVRIPPALRSYTDGQDEVVLEASNVAAMLRALDANFPGIRDRVVDEAGRRRRYANVLGNAGPKGEPVAEAEAETRKSGPVHPRAARAWHG